MAAILLALAAILLSTEAFKKIFPKNFQFTVYSMIPFAVCLACLL